MSPIVDTPMKHKLFISPSKWKVEMSRLHHQFSHTSIKP